MWQKQQQVESHMACALFVNLVELKFECEAGQSAERKLPSSIIKERLPNKGYSTLVRKIEKRSMQVWVIEKSFNCAVAHNSCKSIAENFDRHVTDVVSKLFLTRSLSAFPCCGFLRISASWISGGDCWPVSESGTENILASDSSSESPRPWWFQFCGW